MRLSTTYASMSMSSCGNARVSDCVALMVSEPFWSITVLKLLIDRDCARRVR